MPATPLRGRFSPQLLVPIALVSLIWSGFEPTPGEQSHSARGDEPQNAAPVPYEEKKIGPTPEESLSRLKVAEGFEVSLFAAEPMVAQPLSLTFDDRGRLWVTQYLQYPLPAGLKAVKADEYLRTQWDKVPEPPPRGPRGADRITILEDMDGDGKADQAKDFLTGLNLASGMALGHGGVFVLQTPYLLFYPDRDQDDVPDGDPEVLLKGFGMEDAHSVANSLTWGPDGWLYGAQGSTVTAKIRGIEFQQGIWRYHPLTKEFELFAEGGGNTWGIDFDAYGALLAGGNTVEPLCHHVQGAYYVKGFGKHGPLHNPYSFGYFPPVKHVGYLGNGLTGGFVIYQADYFPSAFRDKVIYPTTRQSAVRFAALPRSGSTFETHFEGNFLESEDRSFRAVDGMVGPDGALYVADWCDDNISHTNPLDRSKWYMPRREDGRIWRVNVKGHPPAPWSGPALRELASDALVDRLSSPNVWHAREARRLLVDRQDVSVLPRLRKMLESATDEKLALEALWTAHSIQEIDDAFAEKLLHSPFEHVREWAIRLLGDRKTAPPARETLIEIARRDASIGVRSQLACSCKRWPAADALAIVAELLRRDEDAGDPHIPLLLWWAIESKAIEDRTAVLKLVAGPEAWDHPIARDVIVERLARRYAATRDSEGFEACLTLYRSAPTEADRRRVLAGMNQQLAGGVIEAVPASWVETVDRLLEGQPDSLVLEWGIRLGDAFAQEIARRRVLDSSVAAADREALLKALAEFARPETLPVLLETLASENSATIRSAVLAALGRFANPEIAASALALYPAAAPELRSRIVDLLVSRPGWSRELLAAIGAGGITPKELSLDQVRRLRIHEDADLQSQVERHWGKVRAATPLEKRGKINAVVGMLAQGTGDSAAGKLQFKKHCAICHRLDGEGNKIGPDLAAAELKNQETLLLNVIDPSAIVRQEFVAYVANLSDGRIMTGLLAESTDDTVTLLDAKNQRTLLKRSEIDELAPAELSLMPEQALDPLSPQETRDLFAYLRADRPATPATGK